MPKLKRGRGISQRSLYRSAKKARICQLQCTKYGDTPYLMFRMRFVVKESGVLVKKLPLARVKILPTEPLKFVLARKQELITLKPQRYKYVDCCLCELNSRFKEAFTS